MKTEACLKRNLYNLINLVETFIQTGVCISYSNLNNLTDTDPDQLPLNATVGQTYNVLQL